MKKHLALKRLRDWINACCGVLMLHSYKIILLVLVALLLGCSKKSPLPKDMASMAQIYDEQTQEIRIKRMDLKDARERISRPLKNHGIDLDGYTRDAHNEIQGIFPELPNPTLVMYLFPHLSENGAPVPGYATTFTMYDKIQYALPGEVGGE